MRLFVALELPEDVRAELCRWTRRSVPAREGLRRLDSEALHATLCFLGERAPAEVASILGALDECARPVGRLELGAPLWLPRRRPRALAVELREASNDLVQLQADLVRRLEDELDWRAERRRFRPHVTIARLGGRASHAAEPLPPTPPLSFEATSMVVYRSHLVRAGARYEALGSTALPPA